MSTLKNEECLICKKPLVYLEQAEKMECALCHKVEESNCRCVDGHYVCSDCHMAGLDAFLGLCMNETSCNPYEILCKLMALPFCHMHGPEHHILVGASLLTAYHNAGGKIDRAAALMEMQNRGCKVPGGICGLWGSCGAAVSCGIFISIITGSSPLSTDTWGLCNLMTSRVLAREAAIGGPRCCKRNSSIAILEAIDFVKEKFGIEMQKPEQIICDYSDKNNQCLKERCPFNPVHFK